MVARGNPRLPSCKVLFESRRQFGFASAAHDPFSGCPGCGNACCVEGELARWQQLHEWHRLAAALVGRIDPANALNLIAKPLNAERGGLACGEEVDNAAAPCNLATATNERDGLVAECKSPRRHRVEGDAISCTQEERLGAQIGKRNRWLCHREQRGHQDAWAPLMPRGERRNAAGRLIDDQFATLVGERTARLK